MRHGVKIDLKAHADAAVEMAPSIERVIIIARLKQAVPMNPGRDLFLECTT